MSISIIGGGTVNDHFGVAQHAGRTTVPPPLLCHDRPRCFRTDIGGTDGNVQIGVEWVANGRDRDHATGGEDRQHPFLHKP